ncbi:MAG: tetratricopeptide repeat protein, partial [Bacteroidales bacterium]|nr:tetratricopeptide repeat protein [Bacteroidales bacterium]
VIAFKSSRSKEGRPVAFGISWFLLALLPTSLIPLAEVLNDHRMFFPFVGLTLAFVGSLQKIPVLQSFKEQGETKNKINSKSSLNETKSKRQFVKQTVIISLAVLILLVFSYSTYQRNKVWQDEETLWYDVTVKSPKNGRGLMNYGLTQMSKGDYENALKYFEQALVYTPYYSILHINLGICKGALGKLQDAENHFKKAIELNPNYDNVYYYYGRFLSEHHRRGDAMEMLIKSVNLNPASLDARYLLMDIYNDFEMWEQLKEQANQTLSLLPGDERSLKYLDAANNRKGKLTIAEEEAKQKATPENYLNLSLIYYQAGLYDKCIAACYEALKLKADYAEAYNNICSAYNALGKWKDAMEACNKAIEIKPDYQLAKNNLNWAKKQSNK